VIPAGQTERHLQSVQALFAIAGARHKCNLFKRHALSLKSELPATGLPRLAMANHSDPCGVKAKLPCSLGHRNKPLLFPIGQPLGNNGRERFSTDQTTRRSTLKHAECVQVVLRHRAPLEIRGAVVAALPVQVIDAILAIRAMTKQACNHAMNKPVLRPYPGVLVATRRGSYDHRASLVCAAIAAHKLQPPNIASIANHVAVAKLAPLLAIVRRMAHAAFSGCGTRYMSQSASAFNVPPVKASS
jgi:hypothetical protein